MESVYKDSNLSLSTLQMGLLRCYNDLGNANSPDILPSYLACLPRSGPIERKDLTATEFNSVLGAFHPYTPIAFTSESLQNSEPRRKLQHTLANNNYYQRKIRGEKKAIPEDQKDDRYYERRKRNNQAAKKSRDARKLREDQVALKAAILEHENAMMRAQILTLREETQALRGMLLLSNKTGKSTVSQLVPLPSAIPPAQLFKPPLISPLIKKQPPQ